MSTHSLIVMQLRATTVADVPQTFAWTAFRIRLGELEIGPFLSEKKQTKEIGFTGQMRHIEINVSFSFASLFLSFWKVMPSASIYFEQHPRKSKPKAKMEQGGKEEGKKKREKKEKRRRKRGCRVENAVVADGRVTLR